MPEAPAVARRFVRDALAALGLPDLVDAATLAASELVTNAALHARTPLTVRVVPVPPRGVRIEVTDASPVRPGRRDYSLVSAVGRGLRLLDALGRWGVEALGEVPGKTVWFEPERRPAADRAKAFGPPDVAAPAAGPVPADEASTQAVLGRYDSGGGGELVTVRLLRFPLQIFVAARQQHDELMREFALLALSTPHGDGGRPLPHRLVELTDLLGRRHRAAGARTDSLRDDAAMRGELTLDLVYRVPASAGADLANLAALLEEADRFCQEERLLTLAALPVVRRFRRWFTGEFTGQIAGRPPVPWPGPLVVPV